MHIERDSPVKLLVFLVIVAGLAYGGSKLYMHHKVGEGVDGYL